MRVLYISVFLFSVAWGPSVWASSDSMKLDFRSYIEGVERNNLDIQISRSRILQLTDAKAQPELEFSPQLFARALYADEKTTGINGIQSPGDQTKTLSQSFGVQKAWGPGVETRLSHSWMRVDVEGLPGIDSAIWSNQFDLELRVNLWRNLLGRQRWANLRAARRALEAQIFSESFNVESALAQAEVAYWMASFAQERSRSLLDSLERARAILAWNQRRRSLNVVDDGDVLQSQAAVLRIQQNLEEAQRLEREARRQMQFLMGQEDLAGDRGAVWTLEPLSFDFSEMNVPPTWNRDDRLDYRAAQLSAIAAREEASAGRSALDPQLDLFARYGGRSLDSSFSKAQSQTFDHSFPQYEIGVELMLPLSVHQTRRAQSAQSRASDIADVQRSSLERRLDRRFYDLKEELTELISRIRVAKDLEQTQKRKLEHEDQRFRQGRSSSFQILSFQEDLAQSELGLLSLYAQLRQSIAQLKLYGVFLGPASQD